MIAMTVWRILVTHNSNGNPSNTKNCDGHRTKRNSRIFLLDYTSDEATRHRDSMIVDRSRSFLVMGTILYAQFPLIERARYRYKIDLRFEDDGPFVNLDS